MAYQEMTQLWKPCTLFMRQWVRSEVLDTSTLSNNLNCLITFRLIVSYYLTWLIRNGTIMKALHFIYEAVDLLWGFPNWDIIFLEFSRGNYSLIYQGLAINIKETDKYASKKQWRPFCIERQSTDTYEDLHQYSKGMGQTIGPITILWVNAGQKC